MGFLEGLGAELTNRTNAALAKTKEVMDVTSLNGEMSKVKKEIQERLYSLGEKYYEAHKEESQCEFIEEIVGVNKLVEEIERINKNIESIKDGPTWFCSKCGAKNRMESCFCTKCGDRK